jgi:hypothetical protein
MAAAAAAGAPGSTAPAAAAGASGSGGAAPGSQGVLIGDKLYSGVLITLENCLLPDDKLRFTPSMSSGLDTDTETGLRVVGCELIQAAGILLRLPQVRARPRALEVTAFRRAGRGRAFVGHPARAPDLDLDPDPARSRARAPSRPGAGSALQDRGHRLPSPARRGFSAHGAGPGGRGSRGAFGDLKNGGTGSR